MINFKLCYKIPGSKNEYIAPQLLDVEPPDYSWNENHNLLLRYHYDFMPKGIITRLIVEMHKFIEAQTLVWKSGVVLTNGAARAEVIEVYHRGEIHLRVSGMRPKELRTVITHEIDKINDSFDRIRVQKLIPCHCSVCNGSKKPHFYQLDELHERFAIRILTIVCGKPPFYSVLVRGLIDETSQPLPNIQDLPREQWSAALGVKGDDKILELRKKSWPIQTEPDMKVPKVMKVPEVFISYAHEDEQFKEEIDEMMEGMKRRDVIKTWQDRLIEPGEDWYEAIQTAMNDADIALLLVSKHFIKSRFINDEEIPKLLKRRESEGMKVIPIIVRPCLWTSEPLLAKLQALPKNGTPVIRFTEENGDRDQVWTDIAEAIEKIAKTFRAN